MHIEESVSLPDFSPAFLGKRDGSHMSFVITIDGPAASGKSTLSRELAKRLNCPWVSTGAFYRGLAYVAIQLQVDFKDVESLSKLAVSKDWSVQMTVETTQVLFRGANVTAQISAEDVGSYASQISHYPTVRAALLQGQRACQGSRGLIAEGRDCGTVVFPQAEVKVYLTANSEDRARRRALEQGFSAEEVHAAQKQRDQQDSTRKAAPLQVPTGAFVLDTTHMSLNEVIDQVEQHVRQQLKTQLSPQ